MMTMMEATTTIDLGTCPMPNSTDNVATEAQEHIETPEERFELSYYDLGYSTKWLDFPFLLNY